MQKKWYYGIETPAPAPNTKHSTLTSTAEVQQTQAANSTSHGRELVASDKIKRAYTERRAGRGEPTCEPRRAVDPAVGRAVQLFVLDVHVVAEHKFKFVARFRLVTLGHFVDLPTIESR